MSQNLLTKLSLVAWMTYLTGCGANIELQRGADDLAERFESSTFYLVFDDGSESDPDNIDGHLNLLWTSDEKRDQIVADQVGFLLGELKTNGFRFVEEESERNVTTRLKIKSVRFDPISGWITDDAAIAYVGTQDDEELGTVVADEVFVTPRIKTVIKALLEGSLELWGISPLN